MKLTEAEQVSLEEIMDGLGMMPSAVKKFQQIFEDAVISRVKTELNKVEESKMLNEGAGELFELDDDGSYFLTKKGKVLMESIDKLVEARVEDVMNHIDSYLADGVSDAVTSLEESSQDFYNLFTLLVGSGDEATRKNFIRKVSAWVQSQAVSSATGDWANDAIIPPDDAARNKLSHKGAGERNPVGTEKVVSTKTESLESLGKRLALVNEQVDGAGQVSSYVAALSKLRPLGS
jgi:hypothetical protein